STKAWKATDSGSASSATSLPFTTARWRSTPPHPVGSASACVCHCHTACVRLDALLPAFDERLHHGRFEFIHQRERAGESRDLRHVDAYDAFLRIDEEVRVVRAAPAETAFRQPRGFRDRIGDHAHAEAVA